MRWVLDRATALDRRRRFIPDGQNMIPRLALLHGFNVTSMGISRQIRLRLRGRSTGGSHEGTALKAAARKRRCLHRRAERLSKDGSR